MVGQAAMCGEPTEVADDCSVGQAVLGCVALGVPRAYDSRWCSLPMQMAMSSLRLTLWAFSATMARGDHAAGEQAVSLNSKTL